MIFTVKIFKCSLPNINCSGMPGSLIGENHNSHDIKCSGMSYYICGFATVSGVGPKNAKLVGIQNNISN